MTLPTVGAQLLVFGKKYDINKLDPMDSATIIRKYLKEKFNY